MNPIVIKAILKFCTTKQLFKNVEYLSKGIFLGKETFGLANTVIVITIQKKQDKKTEEIFRI